MKASCGVSACPRAVLMACVCVLLKSIIEPHTDMSQFSAAQAAEVRPGKAFASCSFFQLFAAAGTKASLRDAREIFHSSEQVKAPQCVHFHPILELVCTLLKSLLFKSILSHKYCQSSIRKSCQTRTRSFLPW